MISLCEKYDEFDNIVVQYWLIWNKLKFTQIQIKKKKKNEHLANNLQLMKNNLLFMLSDKIEVVV